MKYLILIIAILVMACENEQRAMPPIDKNDDLVTDALVDSEQGDDSDDTMIDGDAVDADSDTVEDSDLSGDDLLEDADIVPDAIPDDVPTTLPDTTVATCGNGVVDPGEECDSSGNTIEAQQILCEVLDVELYADEHRIATCDTKWCRWERYKCALAERDFGCTAPVSGVDCDKCDSFHQDYDGDGACGGVCLGNDIAESPKESFRCERGVCEYWEGQAYCSCLPGWLRDATGACTVCNQDNPPDALGCQIECPTMEDGSPMCESIPDPGMSWCFYRKSTDTYSCLCDESLYWDEDDMKCYRY